MSGRKLNTLIGLIPVYIPVRYKMASTKNPASNCRSLMAQVTLKQQMERSLYTSLRGLVM